MPHPQVQVRITPTDTHRHRRTLLVLWRWGTEPWTVAWSVFTDSKTGCSVVRVPIVVSGEYPSTASGCYQIPRLLPDVAIRRTAWAVAEQSVGRELAWPNGLHPPVWVCAHGGRDRIKMSTLDHRNRPRPQRRRPTPVTANDHERSPSLSVGNAATHPPAKQDGSPLTVAREAPGSKQLQHRTSNQPAIQRTYRTVPVRPYSCFLPVLFSDNSPSR